MSDIISKICSAPKVYYNLQSKSIFQLLTESGYLEQPNTVTKEILTVYLTENPDLIPAWEMYSSDKRYSPAWYFQQEKSDWVVGYFSGASQERKTIFQSKFEACAEFILHELKEFLKTKNR